jgi:hypothetical protein
MRFNLFITSPEGRCSKALRSPYPDRESTASTVATVVSGDITVPLTTEERNAFAAKVVAAPLNELVVHEPTGIAFHTEEVI